MKKYFVHIWVTVLTCIYLPAATVTQYSSYVGLLERLFDGFVSIEDAMNYGDHGIGTTHALDGEVIIMDGEIYRINYEGAVERINPSELTPYVTLAFTPESEAIPYNLPAGIAYDQLANTLHKLDSIDRFAENHAYAVRIEGNFKYLKARSVPKQTKPYPSLIEIVENQSVFEFQNENFTVIGFWNPEYAAAFNPPKWHIHGINQTRDGGGHILDFITGDDLKLYLWKMTSLQIHQPDTLEFESADLMKDRSADVHRVNRDQ